jgi:hypothetical protein
MAALSACHCQTIREAMLAPPPQCCLTAELSRPERSEGSAGASCYAAGPRVLA